MHTLLVQFVTTTLVIIPVLFFEVCVAESFFERRVPLKYIALLMILAAFIHAFLTVNYAFLAFRGYFNLLLSFMLPVLFYKGEGLTKRLTCGIIVSFFLLFMDFFVLFLYRLLIDTETSVTFSIKRQICYVVIYFIFLPLFFRMVKGTVYRTMHQSKMFFYQLFLLIVFFAFEIGVLNAVIAVDIEESVSYIVGGSEMLFLAASIFGFFILDFLGIYVLKRLDNSYSVETEIKLNQQKTEMQQKYYRQLEQHHKESRELMHDLKNHLLTLEHLYEVGEREEALRYSTNALENMENIMRQKELENQEI